MSEKQKFAEALKFCATVMNYEITPEVVRAYWEILKGYPIDDVVKAFRHAAESNRFFPKPVELIEFITPRAASLQGDALTAWDDCLKRASDSRRAKSPDPYAEAVIRQLGGWGRLGALPSERLTWEQKEFVARYVEARETGESALARLDTQAPELISDLAKQFSVPRI